ncbi:hypothetical protein O181_012308 [Austropuccinia psidii MF-1]|uniref:Uncharacterized protein n=1 Tax=Austropuccinia psidii MF-1 TaxID=1389203 RepID=A0A9Q3BWK7_9BASI|nr:hypothetical protein [Austropuccinia psidii MF-1]
MSQSNILGRPHGENEGLEYQPKHKSIEGKSNKDWGKSSHYLSHRREMAPERAHSHSFRLTHPQKFETNKDQKEDYQPLQKSPLYPIPGGWKEETRSTRKKQGNIKPE